jgi:hypothetical protein
MKLFTSQKISRAFVVLAVLLSCSVWAGPSALASPAARELLNAGKNAFAQAQYEEAKELLQQAAGKNGKDIEIQMWLGLALYADGHEWEAMSAWRSGVGNPRWEPVADYLRGLAWWQMNRTKDAVDYFKETEIDTVTGRSVRFTPAREAIAKVQAGEAAPGISSWPDLSTLSKPQVPVAAPAKTSKPVASSASKKPVAQNKPKTLPQKGSKPRSGRWVATVHNGYKGDKLTFRVSADGKRVENVEFTGHWMNRNSASGMAAEVLRNLDPPKPFAVNSGAFSAVQQVSKSRMWWEFTGRFTSATTAEGTYRCAFAGGQNDTYQLKWTARYVG